MEYIKKTLYAAAVVIISACCDSNCCSGKERVQQKTPFHRSDDGGNKKDISGKITELVAGAAIQQDASSSKTYTTNKNLYINQSRYSAYGPKSHPLGSQREGGLRQAD